MNCHELRAAINNIANGHAIFYIHVIYFLSHRRGGCQMFWRYDTASYRSVLSSWYQTIEVYVDLKPIHSENGSMDSVCFKSRCNRQKLNLIVGEEVFFSLCSIILYIQTGTYPLVIQYLRYDINILNILYNCTFVEVNYIVNVKYFVLTVRYVLLHWKNRFKSISFNFHASS